MSNLIVNIRFWYWHLQISKKFTSITFGKNYHIAQKGLKGMKKIEIYRLFNIIT